MTPDEALARETKVFTAAEIVDRLTHLFARAMDGSETLKFSPVITIRRDGVPVHPRDFAIDFVEEQLSRHLARVRGEGLRSVLMGEPPPDGKYVHLVECNGDRRRPWGSDHSCSCRITLRSAPPTAHTSPHDPTPSQHLRDSTKMVAPPATRREEG